jgi:hypothetical protein
MSRNLDDEGNDLDHPLGHLRSAGFGGVADLIGLLEAEVAALKERAALGTIPTPPLNFGDCVLALDHYFSNVDGMCDSKWAHVRGYLHSLGLCGERQKSQAELRFDRHHAHMKARWDLRAAINDAQLHLPKALEDRILDALARTEE